MRWREEVTGSYHSEQSKKKRGSWNTATLPYLSIWHTSLLPWKVNVPNKFQIEGFSLFNQLLGIDQEQQSKNGEKTPKDWAIISSNLGDFRNLIPQVLKHNGHVWQPKNKGNGFLFPSINGKLRFASVCIWRKKFRPHFFVKFSLTPWKSRFDPPPGAWGFHRLS